MCGLPREHAAGAELCFSVGVGRPQRNSRVRDTWERQWQSAAAPWLAATFYACDGMSLRLTRFNPSHATLCARRLPLTATTEQIDSPKAQLSLID